MEMQPCLEVMDDRGGEGLGEGVLPPRDDPPETKAELELAAAGEENVERFNPPLILWLDGECVPVLGTQKWLVHGLVKFVPVWQATAGRNKLHPTTYKPFSCAHWWTL